MEIDNSGALSESISHKEEIDINNLDGLRQYGDASYLNKFQEKINIMEKTGLVFFMGRELYKNLFKNLGLDLETIRKIVGELTSDSKLGSKVLVPSLMNGIELERVKDGLGKKKEKSPWAKKIGRVIDG